MTKVSDSRLRLLITASRAAGDTRRGEGLELIRTAAPRERCHNAIGDGGSMTPDSSDEPPLWTHSDGMRLSISRIWPICARVLRLFCDHLFQNNLSERQIGDPLSEPSVLLSQLPHPPTLGDRHFAILLSPDMVRRFADPASARMTSGIGTQGSSCRNAAVIYTPRKLALLHALLFPWRAVRLARVQFHRSQF